jgi:hypothetical protein
MDICLHSRLRSGRVFKITNLPCDVADRIFDAHKQLVEIPWTSTARVTMTDPGAGDRVIKDSDWEVFGFGRMRD